MNKKYRDNVKPRERFIVTLKPNPHDAGGRALYKIIWKIGTRTSVEIRNGSGLDARFTTPFQNGAKEIECYAVLGRNGRWHLVDLVPHEGV